MAVRRAAELVLISEQMRRSNRLGRRARGFVREHLVEIAAIYPPAARRALDEMLGFYAGPSI
jgi:hypothetical protein